MKKKIIVVVLSLVSALLIGDLSMVVQAQQNPTPQLSMVSDREILKSREYIRDQRKQAIAANMSLTPDEATKFWPIYDQYMQETIKINDDRWAMMKEYAESYDTLTDQQAQDYVKKSAQIDQQLLELRMKYVPMFEKVISPKKTALWYQIDRRMDLVLNWRIAAILVPLVDVDK